MSGAEARSGFSWWQRAWMRWFPREMRLGWVPFGSIVRFGPFRELARVQVLEMGDVGDDLINIRVRMKWLEAGGERVGGDVFELEMDWMREVWVVGWQRVDV